MSNVGAWPLAAVVFLYACGAACSSRKGKEMSALDSIGSEYSRQLQIANDRGRAAVEMSRIISANNDQTIRDMDAKRALSNAGSGRVSTNSSNSSFERGADNFDQYMRDTEHVVDQWGQVSDQPNQYNLHWTDRFGNFVRSNDASYDPNAHSNQHYEKAKAIH